MGVKTNDGYCKYFKKSHFENFNVIKKDKEQFNPERGTLNISKAKKLIGYNPSYSLEDGYSKYISWYKGYYKKIFI